MSPHKLRDGSPCGLGDPTEVIGKNRVRAARMEAALVYQRAQDAGRPEAAKTASAQRRSPLSNKPKPPPPTQTGATERAAAAGLAERRKRREARLRRRRADPKSEETPKQADGAAEEAIRRARRELNALRKERGAQRKRGGPWIRIVSGGGGPGSGKRS